MNYRRRMQNMIYARVLEPEYVCQTMTYIGESGFPIHPNTFEKIMEKTDSGCPGFIDSVVSAMVSGMKKAKTARKFPLMQEFKRNKDYALGMSR